nr:triggering receptor expressed on myeloid cells 2 isoform X1 [Taeniopygia guttata]
MCRIKKMPSSCAPSFRHSQEGERSCPWAELALLLSSSSPIPSLLSPMEKLLHLTLVLLAASCSAENVTVVAAMEGDTVSVNCSYDPRQWWREKSWCRQLEQSRCQHVVSAPPVWLPFLRARTGTTSIRDNARAGLLTVTMGQLRREDAGLYQCRTDFLGDTKSLRKVRVEVLAGPLLMWISLFSTSWLDSWWPSSWWLCWSVLLPTAGRTGRGGRTQGWVSSRRSLSLLALDMMELASPGRALHEPSQRESMEKANQGFAICPKKRITANHRSGRICHSGEGMSPSSLSLLPLGTSSPGSYSRLHSQDHSIRV